MKHSEEYLLIPRSAFESSLKRVQKALRQAPPGSFKSGVMIAAITLENLKMQANEAKK